MLVNQLEGVFRFFFLCFFVQVNMILQKTNNYVKLGDQDTMHWGMISFFFYHVKCINFQKSYMPT